MPHFIKALNGDAQAWIDNNVYYEDWQDMGIGIAVDSRMIGDIEDGLQEEGFIEEVDFQIS